jgi:hypothetical protein
MTDTTVRPRTVHLLEYLEAVRNIREQPVRDIADYRDKRWWAVDIPDHPACVVTATGAEPWLRVSKAPVQSPPAVPEIIEPYLRTGATNPLTEPALTADFDETYPGSAEERARLRSVLREYVEGAWRNWAAGARPALLARGLYEDLFELRQ